MFTPKHFTNDYSRHLHPDVLSAIEKLKELYGEKLIFLSGDTKWIHFMVQGLPDELVARQLERRQKELFGTMYNFQILCPSDPSKRGLYLHHLHSPALRIEYKSGIYYC